MSYWRKCVVWLVYLLAIGTFARMLLCWWDLVTFDYIPDNMVSSFQNFTHLLDYSNTCIIYLIWQLQMYKLINFEKCLVSSVRNVNSKFFSASSWISLLIYLLKWIMSMGDLSCPQNWLKNTIFYDMISCSLTVLYHHSGGMCRLHLHYRTDSMHLWDISKFLLGFHFTKFRNPNNLLLYIKCLFAELLISNGPIHKNFQCYFHLWQQNNAWTLQILSSY